MNVLIIEDEAKVVDFVSKGLQEEGYDVSVVPMGASLGRFSSAGT